MSLETTKDNFCEQFNLKENYEAAKRAREEEVNYKHFLANTRDFNRHVYMSCFNFTYFSCINSEWLNDWRFNVIQWWNDWVLNGFTKNKKQLLILGNKSSTGKRFFISQVLLGQAHREFAIEKNVILMPKRNELFWKTSYLENFKIIFCDDYWPHMFNKNMLVSLRGTLKSTSTDRLPAIFICRKENITEITNSIYMQKQISKTFEIVYIPKNAQTFSSSLINPYETYFEKLKQNTVAF